MKRLYSILICLTIVVIKLYAQDLSGVKIFINPGHGGFDGDDRNMTIFPFSSGDPNGFWESQSNLDKGLQLRDLLEDAHATVLMSRTTNKPTTPDYTDDTPLTQIVRMANEANADYMLSIHSNAGVTNYVLQLYAGVDPDDTHIYPSATPYSKESCDISTIIANNLFSNQANTWAANLTVRGDKTFGRTAMGWSDGYGVLRGLRVPGCISEGSMHDYIPETYRLMNMEYKWLEAWHFFKSFCAYFEAGNITTGNIAGTVHDSRNLNLGNYVKIRNSKDELRPLHKAKITVNPGNLSYTTDDLYNGVYVFKELSPGNYQVTAEADGYTPHTENLVVTGNGTTYFNFMLNMIRNTPPEVVSYSPHVELTELIKCSTPIVFNFNWDIDVESAQKAFSITPDIKGTISFEDSQHRMVFTPDKPYEVSTLYTVKLDKSLEHPAGMSMVNDFSFQFKTDARNRLTMFAYNPKADDKEVYYINPTFEFRFDKALDGLYIRDGIKVYDSGDNELAVNARSVKTNKLPEPYGSNSFSLTNNLVPGETYKIVLNRNVIDVDGIDIVEPIEYTFKAIDCRVSDKTIVMDFETSDLLSYDESVSKDVVSASAGKSSTQKLFGNSAYDFKYNFKNVAEGEVVYKISPPNVVKVNSARVIGAHVYGDLTGNTIYLEFKSGDDVQYVKLTDLDFVGWKFVEATLSILSDNKDYNFSGIKVLQKDTPLTSSAEFYMDNLLLYDEPVSIEKDYVQEEFKIYPNPVFETIYVTTIGENIPTLELYTFAGVLLKRVSGTEMNVASIGSGTYILKILDKGNSIARPVIIVK